MNENQGIVAGIMLLLALLVYTFWPENAFASQKEKTRLDFLLERKDQLYENLRDLNLSIARESIRKRILRRNARCLRTRLKCCWRRLTTCRRKSREQR